MKSETPRTDAQMESPNESTVPIEFARQLERDLNAQIEANRILNFGVQQAITKTP